MYRSGLPGTSVWCSMRVFGDFHTIRHMPMQRRDRAQPIDRSSTTTSASRAHARLPFCAWNGGTPYRVAVVPRRWVEDGGGLADGVPFPWRRVNVRGGLVGGT